MASVLRRPPGIVIFASPDVGNDCFFLALSKLGNGFHLTVVDMTAGEKVKQIADGSYAQLAEFSRETGADAFDGRIEASSDWSELILTI